VQKAARLQPGGSAVPSLCRSWRVTGSLVNPSTCCVVWLVCHLACRVASNFANSRGLRCSTRRRQSFARTAQSHPHAQPSFQDPTDLIDNQASGTSKSRTTVGHFGPS
jgi:hypothetical protein